MSKAWRIHAEAASEIDATVAWYESHRSGLGLDYLAELRSTLRELRANPGMSTPDPVAPREARVRRRRVPRFPYAIVFAETGTEYVVIAVAHLRRRPGYWTTRMDEEPPAE